MGNFMSSKTSSQLEVNLSITEEVINIDIFGTGTLNGIQKRKTNKRNIEKSIINPIPELYKFTLNVINDDDSLEKEKEN